jgi:sortase A
MRLARTTALIAAAILASSCAGTPREAAAPASSSGSATGATSVTPEPGAAGEVGAEGPGAQEDAVEIAPGRGRPARALLSIPAIGVEDLVVVPYRGHTDDLPGTEIQDEGRAASPYGPLGGVGPGGIGNYLVTGHRTSSTRAFERLPELRRGARVVVTTAQVRYVYRVVDTRRTSFRSPASLRAQRAPVPGRPGVAPTRAMITLSTCATREDHAAGNYWSDRFGNPEHRIEKIGVLVGWSPRRAAG